MRILDLSRRVKQQGLLTYHLGIHNLKQYLTSRRLIAWSMFGKTLGLMFAGILLPFHGIALNSPVPVEDQPAETQLVLNTGSVEMLSIRDKQAALTITVAESKAQEKERIAREQAKHSASKRVVQSAPAPASTDVPFEQKRALAQRAADAYGIDWKILEAVWQVESGKRWYTGVKSYAGAQGPMQFMPGTWRRYAVDGNGDGHADIYHAEDAVYAAANLLAANGARDNVDRALFAYNHAQWYVDKVKHVASSI